MWASFRFHPDELPLVAIIGGVVFQLINALLVNRGARLRNSPWWIGMMVGSVVFLSARLAHRATIDPDVASIAVRIQYTIGISFALLATGGLEALLGYQRTSRALVSLALAALPLAAVTLFTDWIVGSNPVIRIDLLDYPFFAVGSPRVLLLGAFYIACATPLIRRMRALPKTSSSARQTFRIGSILLLVTGINDNLMSAGLITSLHLFEYAFVFIATASSTYVQRRADEVHRELERAVIERTHELEIQRRSVEAALVDVQQGEQRYRYLAGSTSEAVVVLDAMKIVDSNRAFHEMFHTTATEATGRSILDALGLTAPGEREAVERLLRSEATAALEVSAHRADGSAVAIELRAPSPASDAAHARRVLLMRDVSAQKELQRQLLRADRLAAMGTLAAGTAHEINNPLTYVMNNAQVLDEELAALPETTENLASLRELVADITGGAERIRTIVRDLMALARDRPNEADTVDVRRVLDSSLAIAANQLRHKARVVRTYAEDIPTVVGNEVRLGQVFLNLLVNAADALPDGHAAENTVELEVARSDEGMVVVRVRDSGTGMTHEVRDRIFDPFYTTKDVGRGTGLGLSVSLGIVAALGGRIEVESAPSLGTTFSVYLKPAPTTQAVTPRPAAPVAPTPHTGGAASGRILVVDDEPLIARTIARQLAPLDVEIVHSGRAALERCATTTFDVIVCDLMMPDLTGMEVHARLLERAPESAARMVFVSGGAFTSQAQEFLDHVGNPVLDKPIAAADLRAVVDKMRATPRADSP